MVLSCLLIGCNLPAQLSMLVPTPIPSATLTPTTTLTPTIIPSPTSSPTPLPSIRIDRGDHALINGDWETALGEFEMAMGISEDPQNKATALMGVGRTHYLAGRFTQAISALESLIIDYPNFTDLATVYFYLAQAYSVMERYPEAVQAYSSYLERNPGMIDAYILDLRGDASFAAGDYAQAAEDFLAAIDHPSQLDLTNTQMKRARAHALGGDYQSALSLYDSLMSQTNDDNIKALIDLRKGQVYENLGLIEEANKAYLDAVINYPTSFDSYQALISLIDAGVPVNDLNRGLVDYFSGQYGVALAAFDRYLQNNPADPATAYYYSGMTNRALGGYEAAIQQWNAIILNFPDHPYWSRAWEQKAYTQWNYLEQYTDAFKTLVDFTNQVPTHERAAEFLFDAAQVAEQDGKLDQAAEMWERVINLYPEYDQAQRALFLSGIARYRLGDFAGSFLSFQRLLGIATTKNDQAMAYFWSGKAQMKLGEEAAGIASWEQAANIDPTGYYSERARENLQQRTPFSPPTTYDLGFDLVAERNDATEWLQTTFDLPQAAALNCPGNLVNEPALIRGTALWDLGLYQEARSEFEELRKFTATDAVKSFCLADYLARIGLYRSATLAARQVLDLAGMDDAATLNAPAFFNHLRFGTYFADIILPLAEGYNFHPLFVFSLIRQESLFESFVQSSAAASGLMQIIPATGADIARNLGWPSNYSEPDLYRPLVNLTFGLDYLDTQRRAFNGNLYNALAAYNGGPGNAIEWARLSDGDPDLFLEIIRYAETRDYIRRIFEIFNIYRRLYDRSP